MSELSNEVWKPINSKSSLLYEVSNLGQVRRVGTLHPFLQTPTYIYLEGCVRASGYHVVKIKTDDGYKNITVHRLVAKAFVPNPNNHEVVNHLDGNKLNNNAENLEWTTLKGNSDHAKATGLLNTQYGTNVGNSVLNEELVKQLRDKYLEGKHNFAELAMEFGVNRGTIIDVIHFKRWKHVPLPMNFESYMEAVKQLANKSKSRGSRKRVLYVHPNTPKGSQVGTSILDEAKVAEIRERYLNEDVTKLKLAEEYGVTNSAISDAIYTHTWAHVPVPSGLTRMEYVTKVTEKEKERQRQAGKQAAENRGRPLTFEQAQKIRERIRQGETQRAIANDLSISPSVINSIWKNKYYLT